MQIKHIISLTKNSSVIIAKMYRSSHFTVIQINKFDVSYAFKRGLVRSFHERQQQTESEMKGLILIRLE